ncbi:hypothetical protein JAAARDRAFT_37975 [Jaapia argillacea MUCL 33604]|uniref:Uncharacterized protein n=1 Tax=Jaapia argillacea MUCL 33604 TaxID=933084 RepID=A0A067PX02_9AGAM|nr:hypothetical protein JAAARDRAFT_37975 [Jaapia argillacea MUCL 33604]
MRVKQIWDHVPLPSKLKILWERFTYSRLTAAYLAFSILHCLVQVAFQAQAFSINAQAASFLWGILIQGNATSFGFPVLGPDLRWCDSVPSGASDSSCEVIWDGTPSNMETTMQMEENSVPTSTIASSAPSILSSPASTTSPVPSTASDTGELTITLTIVPLATHTVSPSPAEVNDSSHRPAQGDSVVISETESWVKRSSLGTIEAVQVNGTTQVVIQGLGNTDRNVTLDRSCLWALNWPVMTLEDTKREDITFIAFQFWVLGMSVVALLNESIPHIIASLLTHALATAWGSFQIAQTADFRQDFNRLTVYGACNHEQLLPTYWKARGDAEIASLVLNVVALILSLFLSWRLIKLFGWQTFKRVGASLTINRIYKAVLSLSIVIQLSLFFIVASMGLWIDQIWNGEIAKLAPRTEVYKAVVIIVFILLIPWLAMGWFAVRRELKVPMLIFIILSFLYMAGWGSMFASPTFRWTFVQWRFFGLVATASVALTMVTFILAIVCRMNFGKGLPRYLNAEQPLPGDDFISVTQTREVQSDVEKVAFPSSDTAIPTYSAAFGSGQNVPIPSQMFPTRTLGPRFYNPSNVPFDPQPGAALVAAPSLAHTRSPSGVIGGSLPQYADLVRSGSQNSERSLSSVGNTESNASHQRTESQASVKSEFSMTGRRWIIE